MKICVPTCKNPYNPRVGTLKIRPEKFGKTVEKQGAEVTKNDDKTVPETDIHKMIQPRPSGDSFWVPKSTHVVPKIAKKGEKHSSGPIQFGAKFWRRIYATSG
jgi:hypothetical protein